MRSVLFFFLMTLASASWGCPQQEGQFFGIVRDHQNLKQSQGSSRCSFELELTSFQSSFVCPLFPGEVSTLRIEDPQCQLREGDQLSGILVLKNGILTIE